MTALRLVIYTLMTATPLLAADSRPVTVDDYFTLAFISEIAISPSSGLVAYAEGRWQESTNDRKSDLWVVSVNGGPPRRLTQDRGGYSSLRWSPDGTRLFFLSSRTSPDQKEPPWNGTRQVWSIQIESAEIQPVSRQVGGIDGYELNPQSGHVVYTCSRPRSAGPWAGLRSQFSQLRYGTRELVETEFFDCDTLTGETKPLVKFAGYVDEFALHPHGGRIAMVSASDGSVLTLEGRSRITILEAASGAVTELLDDAWRRTLASPSGHLSSPRWSADGQALAFAIGYDAYPSEIFVAEWTDAAMPTIRKVARPGTVSLHGGVGGHIVLEWQGAARHLCFLGDDHARVRVYRARNVTSGGPVECLTDDDVVVEALRWDSRGETVAILVSHPDRFHNVAVRREQTRSWTPLTSLNEHTRDWTLPRMSIVRWTGVDGMPVEGVLEVPADAQPGVPLPLIVNIHGGPTSAVTFNRVYGYLGSVLYASQGYAFFSPNYRGSTGYGDPFLKDLIGRQNQVDVDDILRGVDSLIAQGIADPERLGVSGWSNGGYLTNCVIARTDRFKAASCGAGILDQAQEWGTNDEPAYPMALIGGTPWEVPDAFRRASPIYSLGKVRTPTVFHVGQRDVRCPPGQSESAFRALKEFLQVESELIVYPGEGHGLGTYASRKAKMTWDLAWFDHYLRGRPVPPAPADQASAAASK